MAQTAGGGAHRGGGEFYQGLTAQLIDGAAVEFRQIDGDPEQDNWPPEQIGYLWHWFNDLTDWRVVSMGIEALSHQEIESWARLFRIDISPFEVDVLRRLDREFRAYRNEMDAPEQATNFGEQLRAIIKER